MRIRSNKPLHELHDVSDCNVVVTTVHELRKMDVVLRNDDETGAHQIVDRLAVQLVFVANLHQRSAHKK